MEIKTVVPRFELTADEATSERLRLLLAAMGETDWLLLHQYREGYRCFVRAEVDALHDKLQLESKSQSFVREMRIVSLGSTLDPILHTEEGDEALELEMEHGPRGRALQVTSKGLRIAFHSDSPAVLSDINIILPPGEQMKPEESADLCPRLEPGERPEGQPFLERNHCFAAAPGVEQWICTTCAAECEHLPEHRLPSGACGRCSRPGSRP